MSDEIIEQATSTELTGGPGFTYEDTVVAYYLAALLRPRMAGLCDRSPSSKTGTAIQWTTSLSSASVMV